MKITNKTPQMLTIESLYTLKFGEKLTIKEILLDFIRQKHGNVRDASVQISKDIMPLSESTLSRWIFSLSLKRSINGIKREFGDNRLYREDSLEDHPTVIFPNRIIGVCTEHGENPSDLPSPLQMENSIPQGDTTTIVIRDTKNVKHSILVQTNTIIPIEEANAMATA